MSAKAATDIERETLSVSECAAFLGISTNHCYEKLFAGEIPARRLGKKWLIGKTSLLDWLAKKENN